MYQIYIPYLIQSSDSYTFSSDLIYSYSLANNRNLGFKLSFLLANQIKLSDNSYMLDYNKYKSFITNFKLFYVF